MTANLHEQSLQNLIRETLMGSQSRIWFYVSLPIRRSGLYRMRVIMTPHLPVSKNRGKQDWWVTRRVTYELKTRYYTLYKMEASNMPGRRNKPLGRRTDTSLGRSIMKRTPHVERVMELLKQEKVNSSIRRKVYNIRDNLWSSNNRSDIFGCLGNTYEDITLHRGVLRTVAATQNAANGQNLSWENLSTCFTKNKHYVQSRFCTRKCVYSI